MGSARFLLLAALGGACVVPERFLSIAEPARRDSVVFVVNDPHPVVTSPIFGFSVVACGTEQAMWTVAADGSRSAPPRFTYGRPIPGFETRTGPLPLKPGCYDAIASGTRPVRFDVDLEGKVHQRPR